MRQLSCRHGTVNTDNELLKHYLEFGLRPAFFISGQFDVSIVGGVHPLTIRCSSLATIEIQVCIFLIAPSGVIDPFVPRILVSLILDLVELFDALKKPLDAESSKYRGSLLQCGSEELHDRFALSP
jgi:hypothetical protein